MSLCKLVQNASFMYRWKHVKYVRHGRAGGAQLPHKLQDCTEQEVLLAALADKTCMAARLRCTAVKSGGWRRDQAVSFSFIWTGLHTAGYLSIRML